MESGAHDGGDGDRRFLLTTTRFPTRTRLSIPPVYTVSRDKQAKYGFWRKRSGAPPCVNAPSPEERIYSFQCSLLPSDKERAIVRAPRIAIHPLAQAGCRCG